MMVSDVSSYSDTPASVPSTLASKRESVGLSTTVTLMSPTVPEGEPLAARNRVVRDQGKALSTIKACDRRQGAGATRAAADASPRRCRGPYVGLTCRA